MNNSNNNPPYAYNTQYPPFNPNQPPPPMQPLYPTMPMMPSVHPGMFPMPIPMPVATSYPAGQGPLANRPVARSANGLFEAPEPETAEAHEAEQYLKLNPKEETQYQQYWDVAAGGEEVVKGESAVPFLSGADKVSRGQLRTIWDIADHRKEGELDRLQFFIALRLVALAQRGAELSIGGLRSFTGIQLIPNIAPPVKEQEEEEEGEKVEEEASKVEQSSEQVVPEKSFSWMVAVEVAERYDRFFAMLDQQKRGFIDGKQGVTFFGKSGLPRQTLRQIWALADVTKDGKLSQDEFRTAMHIVTCVKNNRLNPAALPDELDPAGPNWLRVAGQPPPEMPPVLPETEGLDPPSAVPLGPPPTELPPVGVSAGSSQPSPILQPTSESPSLPAVIAPMPPQYTPMQEQQSAAPSVVSPLQTSLPDSAASAQVELARKEADRAEFMLMELRKERERMDRAREEMEEMRREMEKMRMEREDMIKAQREMPAVQPPYQPPQQQRPQPQQPSGSLFSQPVVPVLDNQSHLTPAVQQVSPPVQPANIVHPPPPLAANASSFSPPVPPVLAKNDAPAIPKAVADALRKSSTPPVVQSPEPKTPPPEATKEPAADDDDIWSQPSPKADAESQPRGSSHPFGALNDDSLSSSDDDDDIWGADGLGAKPSLGISMGSGAQGSNAKGFRASTLDDLLL